MIQAKPKGGQQRDDAISQALPGWYSPPNDLLVASDDKHVFILPSHGIAYVPSAEAIAGLAWMKPVVQQDLGTLLQVPAVGAAGTRIVKIGNDTALILDAGFSTTNRSSAVFLNQLQASLAGMGVNEISQLRILQLHADHVNELVTVLKTYPDTEVVVPRAFLRGPVHRSLQKAIDAVRNDPTLRADRRFGPNWSPRIAKDKGGPKVPLLRYSTSGYVVEQVGLRSALRNVANEADPASYVTKITRTSDGAAAVIIGDPRFVDLEEFCRAMEAWRPGLWNEFFKGVDTISGFSHHFGRMEEKDIPGFLALMDATYFRTGKLEILEQTNTGAGPAQQARQQTIELARSLGVDIAYTDMPEPTSAPSAAGATRDTVFATGPQAVAPNPIQSEFTSGMARLRRLLDVRETMKTWRPLLEARVVDRNKTLVPKNAFDPKTAIDGGIALMDQSIDDLRARIRDAGQKMARVRTKGTVTPGGGRDYSAQGGDRGLTYQQSLAAIATPTQAETQLGENVFRARPKRSLSRPCPKPESWPRARPARSGCSHRRAPERYPSSHQSIAIRTTTAPSRPGPAGYWPWSGGIPTTACSCRPSARPISAADATTPASTISRSRRKKAGSIPAGASSSSAPNTGGLPPSICRAGPSSGATNCTKSSVASPWSVRLFATMTHGQCVMA